MATRSSIAIRNEDGTVEAIYCHFDGYPDHNGKILKEHYADEERVRELISNGDMSVLDVLINPTTSTHCYDKPEDGVCIFYGRDRGEDGVDPRTFENRQKWIRGIGQQYNYLFDPKTRKWSITR